MFLWFIWVIFMALQKGVWHSESMPRGPRYVRIRAIVALHVFLRMTAMDVCCGPPRA